MLQLTPRPGPRMTQGLRQAIGILALPGADLAARLAFEAAGNPALRLLPPDLPGWRRPLADPDGLSAPEGSLIGHVLQQIGLMRLDARGRALALALAERLEPTGWLGASTAEVARACGVSETEVEAVLAQLQRCEPSGIFARSLAECLRLQAAARDQLDEAVAGVLDHLPLLGTGDLAALSRATGLPGDRIARAARIIRGLDPKPGLAFDGPVLPPVPPDLRITRQGAAWQAQPHPAAPRAELTARPGDPRAARLLVEALRHRRDLALRIGTVLADRQADYLAGGPYLQAMTTQELAGLAGAHVATVNRILRAITAETPRGTLPLRALTSARAGRDAAPVQRIKARLAQMLAEAGVRRPSDAALAARLEREGLAISRRTVAKYRHELAGRD